MDFVTIARYFQMLDTLMHVGTAAAHALATGTDPHSKINQAATHLDAFTQAADAIAGGVVATVAAASPSSTSTNVTAQVQ